MGRRTTTIHVDGHRYAVTQLPAMTGLRTLAVMFRALSEPIARILAAGDLGALLDADVSALAPIVGDALGDMNPNDLEEIVRLSVPGSLETDVAGSPMRIDSVQDFEARCDDRGGVFHLLRVMQAVLSVNFLPTFAADGTTPEAAPVGATGAAQT